MFKRDPLQRTNWPKFTGNMLKSPVKLPAEVQLKGPQGSIQASAHPKFKPDTSLNSEHIFNSHWPMPEVSQLSITKKKKKNKRKR